MSRTAFRLVPAVFAAALAFGSTAARAETPVCAGTDLRAAIVANEPERWRAIEARAAGIENGDAVFWKIEGKAAKTPSWLLGTIHLSDPRVTDLKPPIRKALDGARTVALENTSVLDPKTAGIAYAEGIDAMLFTDGRSLPGVLGPETWAATVKAFEARGLPGWAVAGWKPWVVVFGALLYPPCELKRWQAGQDMLDIAIGKAGRARKVPVVDLETVKDQFSSIDQMSEAEQIALLKSILSIDAQSTDYQETSVRFYAAGRIDLLWAFSMDVFARAGADKTAASVMENASFRRNVKMLDAARPLIDQGGAFLAVGALHLIGEKGLVRLLREAGYTVTPVR